MSKAETLRKFSTSDKIIHLQQELTESWALQLLWDLASEKFESKFLQINRQIRRPYSIPSLEKAQFFGGPFLRVYLSVSV